MFFVLSCAVDSCPVQFCLFFCTPLLLYVLISLLLNICDLMCFHLLITSWSVLLSGWVLIISLLSSYENPTITHCILNFFLPSQPSSFFRSLPLLTPLHSLLILLSSLTTLISSLLHSSSLFPTIHSYHIYSQMCLEDEGQLHFYSDQWQATPKTTDGSFLSADEVLDKEVEITFQIFLKRVVRGVDVWDIEIGTGKSIKIIYCPGRPMNIVQVMNRYETYRFILCWSLWVAVIRCAVWSIAVFVSYVFERSVAVPEAVIMNWLLPHDAPAMWSHP